MKLLLYCTKAKPYIMKYKDGKYKEIASFYNKQDLATYDLLNGKIVAECDFEVEQIFGISRGTNQPDKYDFKWEDSILNGACLTNDQMNEYIPHYAIHIKNLHIFDEPKELNDYYSNKELMREILKIWENYGLPDKDDYDDCSFKKAPQNMCRAFVEKNDYILISLKSEDLCKILNGEKTTLVKKKVLKEMIK